MPDNNHILSPGTELFGYRVLEFANEGGWAYVYKAKHKKLPMVVALKQLKPTLVRDERKLQRFLREAHIVTQIKHPNVVTIHDLLYDKETGLHYIVTEFTDKGSLADLLENSPGGLPTDQVPYMAIDICSGLEAAHRKGVIHLDIKPSNILLFDIGEQRDILKVIDFGIAKAPLIEGREIPTDSGIYGSIPYMSPEQLDEDLEIDHRSDLYSLGITLYELLTGRFPFTGNTMKIFWAQQYELPKPPRELRPEIQEPLEQVVLRALRKDPQERYQSAAGMQDALRAIVDVSVREERRRDFQALVEQGQAYLEKEMWAAAIEVLTHASNLELDSERVLEGLQEAREQQRLKDQYDLGIESLEKEEWEKAQEHLANVINVDPDYASGQAKELLEQATRELKRERNQHDLMVQYRTSMGYFRKQQWSPAIEVLKQVVTQKPEFADATDRLAEAQQYVQAERMFEQGQWHTARGEWEEALALFEEVELLDLLHLNATEELQYAKKQWEKFKKEQQLDEWYDEGMSQLAAGKLEQARLCFENICNIRLGYRDVQERLKEIEEKLDVNRLLEQAYEHEAAGEWEQASSVCREVLDIDNLNREAIRCLTRVQERATRQESSITHAQEFNWLRSLTIAFVIGGLCTGLVAQSAKELLASLSPTRLALSVLFLLLIFIPLFILIQWLVAQRAKAQGSPTDQ